MGATDGKHKNKIVSLQALRAIGAILIFLHHSGLKSAVVTAFGDCAVNWFFMLSGFVLAASCSNSAPRLSWRGLGRQELRFLAARFRRVAPMYYIAMLLMVVAVGFHPGWRATLWQGFMLQSWVPDMDVFFGLNGPAWFISDIMFCYVLFLPLNELRRFRPRTWSMLLWAGLAAYCLVIFMIPPGHELYWLYVFPPMQLPAFVLGMELWPVAERLRRERISPMAANGIAAGTVLLVVGALVGYAYVPLSLQLSAYWWVPTGVLIVALTATDSVRCSAATLLHFGPLVRLGDAAYSFFILHLPWIIGTRKVLSMLHVELHPAVELPVSILLLALVSVAIQRTVSRLSVPKGA